MSDVEGLVAAFEAGELLRPSTTTPNIVDLGNAIAGLAGGQSAAPSSNSRAIADLIGPSKHLVFIMADGLGTETVKALGDDSFIAGHVVMQLQTVFPSSTPVVFASLATGLWPNKHAVIGWNMYIREADCVSTIIKFYRRSDERQLSELGVSAEQAYPTPSMTGGFTRDTATLLPEAIANSVYSTYIAGGNPQEGYKTVRGAIDAVLRRVSASDGPTYIHLYVPNVDTAGHVYGIEHEKALGAARELDHEVKRLVSDLPEATRVVLSADHGLLDAGQGETHEIEPSDRMLEFLAREAWGDSRTAVFDVENGNRSRFEGLFRERFGERFYLITVEEAQELEMYGPGRLSPEARRRLGSHVAISKGADALKILYPTPKKDDVKLVSHHSGLTPSEMLVPLVVA